MVTHRYVKYFESRIMKDDTNEIMQYKKKII